MSGSAKKPSFEIRFSFLSFGLLVSFWIGSVIFSFILGVQLNRIDHDGTARLQRFPVAEQEEEKPFSSTSLDKEMNKPGIKLKEIPSLSQMDSAVVIKKAENGSSEKNNTAPTITNTLTQKKPGTEGSVSSVEKKKSASGSKIIQVASFREKERAGFLVGKLNQKGFHSFSSFSSSSTEHGGFYRVYVGPFLNHDEAVKIKSKLEEQEDFSQLLIRSAF